MSAHRSQTIKTNLDAAFADYNDDTGDMYARWIEFVLN